MIKKIFYLLIALFLFSCEEEGEFTKQETQEQVIIDPNIELIELYAGTFAPTSGINVTGQAKVFQQGTTRYVSLENFTISDGPDLKVYLSTTANPDMFVNLGNLTSATNYSIPSEVDLELYKYVLIHCQQYNHLFAIANLN
ncbi:DM13 domain-containing protein [Flavobacterium ponti]|uniref:DM13 domain-containing protein n=1 Tax=Flavobacterium ponti TaxID=665133 RepID=A0ABV9P784_9FLAO